MLSNLHNFFVEFILSLFHKVVQQSILGAVGYLMMTVYFWVRVKEFFKLMEVMIKTR